MDLLQSRLPPLWKRQIGQLGYAHSFRAILPHTELLPGANITLFMSDVSETVLVFDYEHYEFCIVGDGAGLNLTVNDAECPDTVVDKVLRHFSTLSSLESTEAGRTTA